MSQEIYSKIPKVMAAIGGVSKTRKNEQQKYMFRGIEDMYLAVHPAMVEHGIFCAPEVVERTEYRFEKVNDFGKVTTWIHVAVKVAHRFYASDGSSIAVTTWGEGLDNSDKATNKAMSGAMKYALIELFCVPTQDVEDSDRTTPDAGMKYTSMPVTLAPMPRPPKEAPPGVIPDLPPEETFEPEDKSVFLSVRQRSTIAKRFRESLNPDMQSVADDLRHKALTALHYSGLYKSKFIDDHGNPTSEYILTNEYESVGKALVKAAKSL